MTTYSGLALVDHVLRLYRLQVRIKETFKHYQFSGDYHIGDILFVLLVMLLLGAERLQHIDYIRSDPLIWTGRLSAPKAILAGLLRGTIRLSEAPTLISLLPPMWQRRDIS